MIQNLIKTLVIICCTATISLAQYDEKRNIHIGLVYPLSSNGIKAIDYSNKISMHAIAGISGNEEAICLSGLASFVMQNTSGLMGSGFSNAILGDMKGVQLAGVLNFTNRNTIGVQSAGFANVTMQHLHGVQAAEFINIAGSAKGLQGAGFMNITTQHIDGVQLGGFMNIAKSTRGFQGAGFMNVAAGVKGVQAAGFMNKAKDVNTQISGFMNIAKKVDGVQVSGFINIADSSDYPIGIINLVKNGDRSIGITVDQNLTSMLAFRSGGKVLYGIIGAGSNLKNYDDPLLAIEMGLGAHINLTKHFRINTEGVLSSISDLYDGVEFNSSIRILPSLRFGVVEIFAGPTFNYFVTTNDYSNTVIDTYVWGRNEHGDFHGMQLGAIGSIQFHL